MSEGKPWPIEAEREFWRDVCAPGRHEHSLWWFVKLAVGWHWRCTESGQLAWMTPRVHRPWLDWMQSRVMEWKEKRASGITEREQIVICVPRGFGKSNIITKALPLWVHLDEPNMTCYIGSETHPKAKAFLKPMKRVMEGVDPYSWFSWLYGVFYSPERDWNNEEVITAHRSSTGVTEPTIGTFGVETGMTSKHPLLCIYDDPISEEKLKEGGSWMIAANDSLDSIYPALRPDSLFVLIGTRYRDDDPIGTTLSVEGVADWRGHSALESYPAGIYHVYFLQARDIRDTSRFPKGEPVLPEGGWNNEALERSERKSPQKHSAQMMNDPSRGEHMELTEAQIDLLMVPRPKKGESFIPIEYATIHIDTAFKDDARRERGDFTTLHVLLHDMRANGLVYYDFGWRSQKARSEDLDRVLVERMCDLRNRGIRVRAITDEVEQGGKRGVWKQHIEEVLKGAKLRIPEIMQFNRSGTKKIMRIREAAGYWIEGFFRWFDDAPEFQALRYEMARIGRTKHDDMADPVADVFRPELWRGTHQLEVDPQPPTPTQPGDEVLKDQIGRQLFPERYGKFEDLFNESEGVDGLGNDEYRITGPY